MYYTLISDSLQIALGDRNALMPQQPGKCIQVNAILQVEMRKSMAACMREYANVFTDTNSLSGFLQHLSNCFCCQLLPCARKEELFVV